MDEADLLVLGSARLVVVCYILRLLYDLRIWPWSRSAGVSADRFATAIWCSGFLLYLLHFFAAFHYVHHWNLAAAYTHTAQQTATVTGIAWGGGLWVNYLLTVWWPVDIWYSVRRRLSGLPDWYRLTLHAVFGFILFNATVVFGPWFWKWIFAILLTGTGCTLLFRRSRNAR
ncbi:hypothetical protein [Rubinisphaera margarita]|uniref:hypothetical protein n=1 Tax=Rubinisphaera margarita TaxID=2909586 RepID=UPI001EE88807|nr:hypothetical protein [Rubinisphaera margarita]MCG6157066.1 hypothetical protein [Rubinisphaera margarita]